MKDKILKHKVAVITGASRGIGRDIALSLAREGASLLLVCLKNIEKLNDVCKEIKQFGPKSIAFSGDVSKPEFCESIYNEAMNQFGHVDILVNCAGTISRTMMEEITLEEWHRVIDVNLHGAFYMCRMFLPGMREQNYGKVINITSQMAHVPHPNASPSYEVSKAGLTAMTRHLAFHYAKYNVCVNAIAPGSINTDMPKSMSKEARDRMKNAVPMKRLGKPEEIGACALFLASESSNYITGITIHVNGGSFI